MGLNMARVGYARVSTQEQSLEVQLDKLKTCDKIFSEKRSGTSTNEREEFNRCMNYLREGDQLVVTKLDMLARSVRDLNITITRLQAESIDLIVLDQNIDTSTPTGRLLFHVLGAIAEFENDLRKERQLEGITKAKQNGVKFGPKTKLSKNDLARFREGRKSGKSVAELCEVFKVSRSTAFRLLAKLPD
jgi:DNA invertase Pin-like site-specific DNA recombinase